MIARIAKRRTEKGRESTKESGNTRLLIVVSPLSPGVVRLGDEQRRVYIIRREAPKCTKSPFLVWDTTGRFEFSEPARSTSQANRGDPRPRSKRRTRNQNQIRSGVRHSVGRRQVKQVEIDPGRSAKINTTIEIRTWFLHTDFKIPIYSENELFLLQNIYKVN